MPKKGCCYAPKHNARITIQRNDRDVGDPAEEFTPVTFKAGVSCRIVPTGGDETFRGRQQEAHLDYVIDQIPYFAGVLPTMRVLVTLGMYKDSILEIAYVIRKQLDNGFRVQEFKCREMVLV